MSRLNSCSSRSIFLDEDTFLGLVCYRFSQDIFFLCSKVIHFSNLPLALLPAIGKEVWFCGGEKSVTSRHRRYRNNSYAFQIDRDLFARNPQNLFFFLLTSLEDTCFYADFCRNALKAKNSDLLLRQ